MSETLLTKTIEFRNTSKGTIYADITAKMVPFLLWSGPREKLHVFVRFYNSLTFLIEKPFVMLGCQGELLLQEIETVSKAAQTLLEPKNKITK
jgi:hypothetical protein